MKLRGISKRHIAPRTLLRSGSRQFGTSTYLPVKKSLDIGCGPGFLCEGMSEIVGRDGTVVGIDISRDLVELCDRRKHPIWLSYEVGDGTKLNQLDASFDVVVCTQVAEYIPDVDAVLSEAFRVLRPGGRTILIATDRTPSCGFPTTRNGWRCSEVVGGALRPPASAKSDAPQAQ